MEACRGWRGIGGGPCSAVTWSGEASGGTYYCVFLDYMLLIWNWIIIIFFGIGCLSDYYQVYGFNTLMVREEGLLIMS
jgi:hypothetical protein